MLGGVVGGVWNDSASESRFPVYGKSPVCSGPMDGDVKEVFLVVSLAFHCELPSVGCIVLKSVNMFWASVWLVS